jgi:arylsulfatase/uncharacterized sulfatase
MELGLLSHWNARILYNQSISEQGRPGSLTATGAGFASASAAPLRGYKFTASEGGLRVPLIVAWPGHPEIRSGAIAGNFTYVTDIAPTLLALAGAPAQQGRFAGRAVEPMRGADLRPMLANPAAAVHAAGKPIGYELSGNAALFKGHYKLVKNLPPYGDGRWRLYDILSDPGETRDLSADMPARFAQMQADYAAFAKANGVLPMPPGYSAPQQIFDNALDTLLIPRLLAMLPYLCALAVLLGGLVWVWRRRRHRITPVPSS